MKSFLDKYIIALIPLLVFFIFSSQVEAQSIAFKALLSTLYDADFPVLKPSQVSDLSNFQVLDTREKDEFEVSHLKNAMWVGYDTFTLKNVASLDESKPVLVYCTVGARSQDIGKKLKEAGYTEVYNLYGGLIEWVNEGKPIFQGDFPTKKVHTYSKSWGIWLNKGEKVY
ncbi:rhodanese-like domain-containing protein [Algoriphagus persicinus]|uniref:rhodanese-like domain-containing protein n=1 Tax=Algoriphagus persicinus TaxID=3108754 RepID=UPI002B3CB24B|nr:rhodanese-like domain-containing protein [Algoriphagus sp. E1-3-M2]MEB2784766.1 rhodanese-like domain-containing protein [Algoriphagus sp. E1-3-M2]